MNIGEIVKNRRIELGYSQNELAEMTGLSATSISNIECGRPCTVTSLQRVCGTLDMGIAFTLDEENCIDTNSAKSAINECCKQLTDIKKTLQDIINNQE